MTTLGTPAVFAGRTVALVAGDKRQHEIARNVVARGGRLRVHGVPPWDPPEGVVDAASYAEAVAGADLVVLPVPTFLRDGVLYAPARTEVIPFGAEEVALIEPGSVLAISKVPPDLAGPLRARGITPCVMANDDIMQVHHAIPTAEGALRITIEHTDFTVFGARAVVTGYGRVAQSMARALKGLGAHVTVVARREEARVRAYAEGFATADVPDLPALVGEADLVYNTVPTDLITADVLRRVRRDALVMDLASPPGGVDQRAAEELGVTSVWARGQAGSAPREAGRAQFEVIERFLLDARPQVGAARGSD